MNVDNFGTIFSLRHFAVAPVSFIVLVACVLLVLLRAWSEVTNQRLTLRARYLVNTVTFSFVVFVVVLTMVRFKVLA